MGPSIAQINNFLKCIYNTVKYQPHFNDFYKVVALWPVAPVGQLEFSLEEG